VIRRNGALAEDFAVRHGKQAGYPIKWYDSAEGLLADAEVDCVYIATPPGSHLELARQAASARKAVYVEKPMARTAAECTEMVALFESMDLPLFCGYYRRHLPKYLAVKELLPKLGGVTEARIRLTQRRYFPGSEPPAYDWRTDPETAGGGLFMDLGSHQLDIIDFLLGPVLSPSGVSARMAPAVPHPDGWRPSSEDNVRLIGTAGRGVLVSGSWNFAAAEKVDQIEICGPLGAIRFSCFDDAPPVLTVSDRDGGVRSEAVECDPQPAHVHLPAVVELVKDLQRWKGDKASWRGSTGGGRLTEGEASHSAAPSTACAATGVAAARTNAVLDAPLVSFYGSRRGAFWEGAPAGESQP